MSAIHRSLDLLRIGSLGFEEYYKAMSADYKPVRFVFSVPSLDPVWKRRCQVRYLLSAASDMGSSRMCHDTIQVSSKVIRQSFRELPRSPPYNACTAFRWVISHPGISNQRESLARITLRQMSSKRIVVVGGGGAGVDLARALSAKLASSQHSITLITDRDYYPFYISALRTLAVPVKDREWSDSTFLSLDYVFKNGKGKVVFAKATSIQYDNASKTGNILTEKGEAIPFDVLALATGSIWESPLNFGPTKEEALQQVLNWRERIRDAKSVVLVGGGAVGIELAGEIRDRYPSKAITIVHNKPLLLNPKYPDKFRRDVANRLAKRNIHLVLDDSINVDTEATEVVTVKGYRVDADLLIPTRGPKPNPSLLRTLSSPPITGTGHADIEATLQLKNYPTIFALGDLISWEGEVAQKGKHARQVPVACNNILDVVAGQEPKAKYKAGFEGIFITIGKDHGAGYVGVWWGLMFGNWVVGMIKGKELFVSMTKKAIGYQI